MLAKVRETINKFNMLNKGDRIVIAVSGGPDSMALLHILRNLQKEYKLELFVAHVNHMFRGDEADADAVFVAEVCQAWNIPCFITRVNVPVIMAERGLSAQVAAREVRYHFFKHVAGITGSNKIALGHNADDQAETILMRFIRGAGPEGLTGIPAVRCGIIRPLIGVFRAEIERYCQEWGIEAREDSSNKKTVYVRNRVRNYLIPHLEDGYNSQVRRNLLVMGEILQDEEEYWAVIIEQEFCRTVMWKEYTPYIRIEQFKGLAKALQRRILRKLFQHMDVPKAGFIHVEEVRNLLGRSVGANVDLPGTWRAVRCYKFITLEKGKPAAPQQILRSPILLQVPGTVHLPGTNIVVETTLQGAACTQYSAKLTGLFDWDRLHKPLYVRTRRPGDRFFHLGIGHRKKLKEYFIDRKISRAQRDRVLLVLHGDDILWIVGYYADGRYTADESTKEVLRIEFGEE